MLGRSVKLKAQELLKNGLESLNQAEVCALWALDGRSSLDLCHVHKGVAATSDPRPLRETCPHRRFLEPRLNPNPPKTIGYWTEDRGVL